MRNVLADLAVESEAATTAVMRLAGATDRAIRGDEGEAALPPARAGRHQVLGLQARRRSTPARRWSASAATATSRTPACRGSTASCRCSRSGRAPATSPRSTRCGRWPASRTRSTRSSTRSSWRPVPTTGSTRRWQRLQEGVHVVRRHRAAGPADRRADGAGLPGLAAGAARAGRRRRRVLRLPARPRLGRRASAPCRPGLDLDADHRAGAGRRFA